MSPTSRKSRKSRKSTPDSRILHCGAFRFDLARPLVMGVVNITPDSFSDGGSHFSTSAAIAHAERLIAEGADLIDLGAESSRPGAPPLPLDDELARLLPVLRALVRDGVAISVDTYKPETMHIAAAEGAAMINDIYGLRLTGALEAVAASDCAVCAMHMQHEPATMQLAPSYDDVVGEVADFLRARLIALEAAGIARARVVLDPGFGFGKTAAQNYTLLAHLDRLAGLGAPVLAGVSRKSMIGAATGKPVDQRLAGSVAAALAAVDRGARIVRVHDVAATVDALNVWRAVESAGATLETA